MFILRSLLCLLALTFSIGRCAAGIIVTIDNAIVSPGDLLTLDVRVSGDASYDSLSERLDYFISVFRITPIGAAPAGGIAFDDPQVNAFDADADYVFFGNSGFFSRDVTMNTNPADTLTVVDFTADFSGVDLTATDFLLARLELSVNPGLVGMTQYQISLVEDESEFQNELFDPLTFTSSGGLITVNGSNAAAVPEPHSTALIGIGFLMALFRRRSRFHRHGIAVAGAG